MLEKFVSNVFQRFSDEEDAAVTVDWVVLTSAIVVLGVLVIIAITPSLDDSALDIHIAVESAYNPTLQ